MPIQLTESNIDPTQPQFANLISNMQGNILKSHGRELTAHILIQFTADSTTCKKWVAGFTQTHVTSLKEQLAQTARHDAAPEPKPSEMFCNFFLTAEGYKALGFGASLNKFVEGSPFVSAKFVNGMKAARAELNDPPVAQLEPPYRERIDAMILFANDDLPSNTNKLDMSNPQLDQTVTNVINSLSGIATVLVTERGMGMTNSSGEPVEHFGYRDGISQPLFLRSEIVDEQAKQGFSNWDPKAELKLALVKDPFTDIGDAFGSYFVFRKLEQNVRAFKKAEEALADKLGLTGNDRERAGAMCVGRFENGSPLVLSDDDSQPNKNDFAYPAIDANATKCPFHAHIRKTNPRGDNSARESFDDEKNHRIVRRGITYGTRDVAPSDDQTFDQMPTEKVGLLFMCFQSNIANQFAFMQKLWANNEDFVDTGVGIDPVVGQNPGGGDQKWNKTWGQSTTVNFNFRDFVKFKGGEFFFAPSLPFLKNLSN